MSAKLFFLAEDAKNCLQDALKYEAMANENEAMRNPAERRAYQALDRIETLALYAKMLEVKLANAEAKLHDAIDAENV